MPIVATMTINGTTVPIPEEIQPYASDGGNRVVVPIDGKSIVFTSPNSEGTGDKNARRRMRWSHLPTTHADWGHTTNTLKALEGSQVNINAGTAFASIYVVNTAVIVEQVNIKWKGYGFSSSIDLWEVELIYSLA